MQHPARPGEDLIVPLHTEELSVRIDRAVVGTVRVHVLTAEHAELVDEDVSAERVVVERVPIGRRVDAAPAIREEGDVTIIPVFEEIVVVEKRLFLKEEIHLRRVRKTERHSETVLLREQHATVERTEA